MEDDATMKLSATVLYPRTNLASLIGLNDAYLWDLVHPPRQTMLFYHFSLIVIPSALWRFTAPFRKFSGPMSTFSNVPSKSQPQEIRASLENTSKANAALPCYPPRSPFIRSRAATLLSVSLPSLRPLH
ncbi:hypothetical protein C8R43DRAFT_1120863 [Mycena crocata]|nr:hypothetical protein C8R43DRAFT_1120863 [Mycena crocata]